MRPFAHAEGHDLPWLVDEVVRRLMAAQRDDVFVGFEDPVRQPVVAHELPLHSCDRCSTRASPPMAFR